MKKVTRIVLGTVILIVFAIITIGVYFFFLDIESTPSKLISQNCNIKQERYNGRKIFTITGKGGDKLENKVIFYLHGGSYVAEMSQTHWNFISDLANDSGYTIILPDYPLTPKYNYMDVFEFIEPIYNQTIGKYGAENVIVMGDSAGGGMSLALCEKIAEQNGTQPSEIILISPWLDVEMKNEKIEEVQKNDKVLVKETLVLAGISYAGIVPEDVSNYLVSPINGDLTKIQNITIYTGTYDILNPDVNILKSKYEEVHNENNQNDQYTITVKQYEKEQHIWMLDRTEKRTENAEKAYQDLIKKLRESI